MCAGFKEKFFSVAFFRNPIKLSWLFSILQKIKGLFFN